VGPTLTSLFSFLLGPTSSEPLVRPALALELMVAGSVLGLVGSFIAVGRFLRV
jgi:cell division transport system permease protein